METPKNECKQGYLSVLVASVVSVAVKPLVSVFPFTNRALDCDRDFDLSNVDDNDQVDKHLADFMGTKQSHNGNKNVFKLAIGNFTNL